MYHLPSITLNGLEPLLDLPGNVTVPHVRCQLLNVLEDLRSNSSITKVRPHVAVVSMVVVLPLDFLDCFHEMQGLV